MNNKSKYIQKFKEIYQKKTGKVISDEEVLDYLEKLATLVEAVYQPSSKKFFRDGSCPHCKRPINFEEFKDKVSLQEFTISGLCQGCQDEVFKT